MSRSKNETSYIQTSIRKFPLWKHKKNNRSLNNKLIRAIKNGEEDTVIQTKKINGYNLKYSRL